MSEWPRVVDEQHDGDPFVKLVECGGKHYLFDEAALVEQQEAAYRAIEMDIRLTVADGLRRHGLPW